MTVALLVRASEVAELRSGSNCGIRYELCQTSLDQELCESRLDMVRPPDLVKREVKALIAKRWYHLYADAQEA